MQQKKFAKSVCFMVGSKFQGEQAPSFPLLSSALDAATTLIKYSSNMLDKYFNMKHASSELKNSNRETGAIKHVCKSTKQSGLKASRSTTAGRGRSIPLLNILIQNVLQFCDARAAQCFSCGADVKCRNIIAASRIFRDFNICSCLLELETFLCILLYSIVSFSHCLLLHQINSAHMLVSSF